MSADICTATVQVSDQLDRLYIVPCTASEAHILSGILRDAMPGIRIHRSAEGFWLSPFDTGALLNAENSLELRWSLEAELFVKNRQRAFEQHTSLHNEVTTIRMGGSATAETHIGDVAGLGVLDAHQKVNVAAMTIKGSYGLCIFDEQGAGKTVTGIFGFDVLAARGEVDFMLIVAPKSMVSEWPRDIERFKQDLYKVEIVTGSHRQKQLAISSGADILVTNFETTVSMESELRSRLRRYHGRAVLVVDESFYAKNMDANRTRALRRLREYCDRAFMLCGTPAPNSPHDLIGQFNLVDYGFTFDGVDVPKDREEARPVVQQAIEQRGLYVRHLKADVLPDLPVKSFNRVIVPLEPQQQRIYTAALDNLVLDLAAVDNQTFQREFTSFLARRSALLQICSNPSSFAEGYSETPAKLNALDGLLNKLIADAGEKVVLWSFYTASLSAMFARYSQFNPVRYDGTVSDVHVRREAVRRFQDDDETMLFIANPAAAGAGITLHRAKYAIYESMSNQAAHYLQSLDRIHRRGQDRDVEYMILLCDKTIEIEEYDRLVTKERAAQALLGDQVSEPVTRETMLNEVLAARDLMRGDNGTA